MRSCLAALILSCAAAPALAGPQTSFPYEATVEAESTLIRSGVGHNYYPTLRLKQGDRVTVLRHDPGGWHMIAPPAGSFSWIPARYVDKGADDRGVVNTNNVAVPVGSFESDIREVFHRTLSQGDEVRILGEKLLDPVTGTGPQELWYRIVPPRGEWRWIAGQALSPPPRDSEGGHSADRPAADGPAASPRRHAAPPTRPLEGDEFEPPTERRFEPPRSTGAPRDYHDSSIPAEVEERAITRRAGRVPAGAVPADAGPPAVPNAGSAQKRVASQLEELDRLDSRFRSILDRDPVDWNFADLEQDYRRLAGQTDNASLRQMIDARLLKMVEYAKTRAEHEELEKIAAETGRRDAELAEQQRRQEAKLSGMLRHRFDGAGIVQRAAINRKGAPRYALTSPDGRVLAYLVPGPGMNLEAWVGRSAGVNGRRIANAALRADVITVQYLTPVKLAQ